MTKNAKKEVLSWGSLALAIAQAVVQWASNQDTHKEKQEA